MGKQKVETCLECIQGNSRINNFWGRMIASKKKKEIN